MNFEIINQTDKDIEELSIVDDVIRYAMNKEKIVDAVLNIIIVDNDYIHKLNKEYRNVDKVTDVISFALEDEDKMMLPSDIRVLGDIYISIDKAEEQAKEYGHSLKRELSFLAVHGFYHLMGYDHDTKEKEIEMFKKQEEVLDEKEIFK